MNSLGWVLIHFDAIRRQQKQETEISCEKTMWRYKERVVIHKLSTEDSEISPADISLSDF
jgi:hypothetical protein